MKIKKTVRNSLSYIGAMINEGQKKTGVENGPNLIRNSGLFELLKQNRDVSLINDHGNISRLLLNDSQLNHHQKHKYVYNAHILDLLLGKLSSKVTQVCKSYGEDLLLTVGGDHSVATATIHGLLQAHPDLRVIWVDAHSDFCNPFKKAIPDQNYHGMPLAHICGHFSLPGFEWKTHTLSPNRVVLIAIRDIEPVQFESLAQCNIKCFTMDHIDTYGIGEIMSQAISYLDPKGQAPFHISFDVDALDPEIAPNTGTCFRYGLSPRQAIHIVRRTAHQTNLIGLDLVEINSIIGTQSPRTPLRGEQSLRNLNSTEGIGIDIVESAFTKYLTL